MNEDSIKIERVRVKELCKFAETHRDDHTRGGVVPISRLRASAQTHNPAASEDDLALLAACRNGVCVGYLGLMAGWVRVKGERKSMYWFTTWYVHPNIRQTAVGALLMITAMSLDRDVIANGIAPQTLPIYRRLRFEAMGPLLFERFNAKYFDLLGLPWLAFRKLLSRRGLHYKSLDFVFRCMRTTSLFTVYMLLDRTMRELETDYEFHSCTELPEWVGRSQNENGFERSKRIVSWMLDRPWLTDNSDQATPAYFFSDFCDLYQQPIVRFRSTKDGGSGWIALRIARRNCETVLKVLDYEVPPNSDIRPIVAAALRWASRYRADIIEISHDARLCLEQRFLLRRLFRTQMRPYFCHLARKESALRGRLEEVHLNYCDGDTSFT